MHLNELTIAKAHEGLKKKEFSCAELTRSCLKHIQSVDKDINAFITILRDEALEQAKALDKEGTFLHALSGIPLSIKDNINIMGIKTTAGSRMLENFIAPFDATVIQRLKKRGAIFIGKVNLDEFACGSSTETSFFGPTKNPHDTKRVPGGTSGGSAAAAAANECIASLGSDTGGSIRQPASLCGVVGLKPTYGRVSRYGLLAMASSFDQIGPVTKDVQDAALLYEAIAGHDQKDSTTSTKKIDGVSDTLQKIIQGLKVGVPREYISLSQKTEGLDEGVRQKIIESIKKLEGLGAKIDDSISLPHAKYGLPVYYIIMPSELSSNLERYDGIKYGLSKREGKNLFDIYQDTRGQGFGPEIRRRIMLGTYALSAGYYDAYYKKALKVRTLIIKDFMEAFKKVDVLVTPTSPTVAFKIGEKINDPLSMYLGDIYTVSANIAGIPAISVPCGTTQPQDGDKELPVGLQIMGKHFDEQTVFRTAYQFEKS